MPSCSPLTPHETKEAVPIDQELHRAKDLRRLQESSLNPHQQNMEVDCNSLSDLIQEKPKETEREPVINSQHSIDMNSPQEETQQRETVEDEDENLASSNSDNNSDTSENESTSSTRPKEDTLSDPDMRSIIFFDWDDTILASSFLFSKGFRLDTEVSCQETIAQLKELEQSVVSVMTLALQFGTVNIITNAETGWVELSAQKFLPRVVPLLSRVKIISARSTFEQRYPQAPLKWKFCAFQESLTCVTECKSTKNIISFGDSHVEREAVRAATRPLLNTRTKSVKFAERPSMEQLRRQIELVTKCFHYIFHHDGDLDLMLTISLLN